MKRKSTLNYFAIAGIIGSFHVVSDKGWVYLIPFWIIVFVIAKFCDWLIKKWNI
jgi:hypothetical protein